jgi:sulfofructose kinase
MDVVGIGYACIDFLINIDKFPESNHGTVLRDYSWQGGGKVPTALVALGRLGVETGLIGLAGDDAFGRFIVEDFKQHHVDTSRLIIERGTATSLSIPVSEIEKHARSFIFNFGTCRRLHEGDLDEDYIAKAKILHISDISPVCLAGARMARKHGVKVVIDADAHHGAYPMEDFKLLDVLVGSEYFYKAHFNDLDYEANCREIMRRGPRAVVFTFGERGCVGMDKENGYFELPAFKVEAVDTTGAGDVYHGAFLYGLLQNWTTKETARFASAVSAIKCTRLGGRAGIPDLKTTLQFLKDGTIDYGDIDERVEFYRNLPGSAK